MIKLRNRKLIIAIIVLLSLLVLFLIIRFLPKSSILAKINFSQVVYDEHGQLLRLTLSKDQKYRVYTPLQQISPLLIEATLLQEDRYFYSHIGVNPVALSRAIWHSYIKQTRLMGASTITMQVARMRYQIYSRNLLGKLKQIYYALYLELFYSKNEILEAYLNLAPYGGNIEGIGAASLIYFNKTAYQLTLSQALALSVIPQNPVQRSNTKDNNILRNARNRLFQAWLSKYPDDEYQKSILNLPWSLQAHKVFLAPHMTNHVLTLFPNQPTIHTTLDYKLQSLIEKISHHYLANQKQYGIHNVAVMLVDTRDMGVKSLLGSADFLIKKLQVRSMVLMLSVHQGLL